MRIWSICSHLSRTRFDADRHTLNLFCTALGVMPPQDRPNPYLSFADKICGPNRGSCQCVDNAPSWVAWEGTPPRLPSSEDDGPWFGLEQ
jgi:hypothetical protein